VRRFDWSAIEAEYVTGGNGATLEALASRHGCGLSTIKEHSRRGKWEAERRQYRDQVKTEILAEATTVEVETRVRHLAVARQMLALATDRLERLAPDELSIAELRHFIRDACEIERRATGMADAHEIKAIVDARFAHDIELFMREMEVRLPPDIMREVVDAVEDMRASEETRDESLSANVPR
jgi:hypothetical protein